MFGDSGFDATTAELNDNLISRGVIQMLMSEEVTSEIHKTSLSSLMFLKRKRSEKVNARRCADGGPQQEYITKEESSSPIVSLIDGRKIITCDILRAFLQADWPDDRDCYIKFQEVMVDMIYKINPEYKKNVITTKTG